METITNLVMIKNTCTQTDEKNCSTMETGNHDIYVSNHAEWEETGIPNLASIISFLNLTTSQYMSSAEKKKIHTHFSEMDLNT